MKYKKILVVALALAMSLQVAAFSDIPDENMRLAANTLKTLGIVDGYGDGKYHPEDLLNRAAFAKIAVTAKKAEDKLPLNKSLTVFSDVLSSHWASAYINVAVRDLKIINGFPDGTFRPDEPITNAQAITIALSMLGFQSKDIGLFWPRDQINRAVQIGLIADGNIDPNQPMTRGAAAILLNNLMGCEEKEGGKDFITNFGETMENVLLIATSKTNLSMQEGLIKYVANGKDVVSVRVATDIPESYVGKMVSFIINKEKEIVGLIPTDTTVTPLVLKSVSKEGITDSTGKFHTIALETPMVINTTVQTYEKYMYLKPGSSVNLIKDKKGNLLYVQSATGALADNKHYVLAYNYETGKNPLLDFYSTDIVKAAKFIKDGIEVGIEAFRKGDVVTLSADKKTISASSAAISGKLGAVSPTLAKAQSIELYGSTYPLAASYTPDLTALEDQLVTISLAIDGSVAKIELMEKDGPVSMVGVMTEAGNPMKVELSNGYTIQGKSAFAENVLKDFVNTLVKVRPAANGDIVIEPVALTSTNYGTFDIAKMTYRNHSVSQNVKLFERAGEYSGIKQIKLEDINSFERKVDGSAVAYYEVNGIGQITLMVLTNVTGNMFQYGKMEVTGSGEGTNYIVNYLNEKGEAASVSGKMALQIMVQGPYGGLHVQRSGDDNYVRAFSKLTEVGTTNFHAFEEKTVAVGGRVVALADTIFAYDEVKNKYMTVEAAFEAGYKEFKILVDKTVDTGGIVRMVLVK